MGNSCPEIQPLPWPSSLICPILIILKSSSVFFLSSYAVLCGLFPSLPYEHHPLRSPLPFSPSSLDGPSISSVSSSVPLKSNRFFPGAFLESGRVALLLHTQHIHHNLSAEPTSALDWASCQAEFILRFRAELWGLPDLFCGLTVPCINPQNYAAWRQSFIQNTRRRVRVLGCALHRVRATVGTQAQPG